MFDPPGRSEKKEKGVGKSSESGAKEGFVRLGEVERRKAARRSHLKEVGRKISSARKEWKEEKEQEKVI